MPGSIPAKEFDVITHRLSVVMLKFMHEKKQNTKYINIVISLKVKDKSSYIEIKIKNL